MQKILKFMNPAEYDCFVNTKLKTKKKKTIHLSPSPRNNPFNNMKSFDKLPKLRPISPILVKMPKSPRNLILPATAPPRIVSLKLFKKEPRIISPRIRNIETPKFLEKD